MPAPARPALHTTLTQGTSTLAPTLDPVFTASDFDVKAWINAALDSYPHQDSATATNISSRRLSTHDNPDPSLDASLDLLQTPALDPALDGKDQVDLEASSKPSSSSSTSSLPASSSVTSLAPIQAAKSQTTFLTQHATTHLTKLHLLASQTSVALSSTTQDMVKLLPRLTYELDQLRQETKILQEGIRLVRSDINTVESTDTVQALDRLKYLDLVKTRMEATHSALREAENWRNLEAEAQDIFAKGDFTRAAKRLSEAERSLVVYKNTNVESDRMALLLVLKDQLEEQVMGRVKEALEQKDTAACQNLISVFGLIGRQEKFQESYISQRRTPLMEQWKRSNRTMASNLPSNATSAEDPKEFINALQAFYTDASSMLHDEFAWITSIFSDPTGTIHSLVYDIFSHLDPTLQASLQRISRQLGEEGSLPVIILAFAATEAFGTRMERIVAQPLVGNQREHGSGGMNSSRLRSGTLLQDGHSSDGKGGHLQRPIPGQKGLELGSAHDPHEWAYILYEPFMAYQRDFGRLEEAHLRALLGKSIPAMANISQPGGRGREQLSTGRVNLVKIMESTNTLAFNLAEGAIGRCMRLTHGFGAPGLLDGLNGFLKDVMDRYTEILIECRRAAGLQMDGTSGQAPGDHVGSRTPGTNSRYESRPQNEDDEDSEGWDEDEDGRNQEKSGLLQMGLLLMVHCRQLCLKLEQLDVKTKKALRGVDNLVRMELRSPESSPFEHSQAGSAAQKIGAQAPPNASLALLQQSNLNSFRLSEILTVVQKAFADKENSLSTVPEDGYRHEGLAPQTEFWLEPKAHHLYLESHQRAVQLTKLCQRFIFDSIYLPLVKPLDDLALLPCWTEGMDQQGGQDLTGARRIHKSTMGGTRTDVYKFSAGPSEYIEELVRGLSSLLLDFGVYEGDAGLRFGSHALPYADSPLEAQEPAEQIPGDKDGQEGSGPGGEDQEHWGVGDSKAGEEGDKVEGSAEAEEDVVAEEDDSTVMHRWMTSLSRAAMHTIIERLYDPSCVAVKSMPTPGTPPLAQRSRFAGSSSPALSGTASPGGPLRGTSTTKERHYLVRLSDAGAKQLELDLRYFVRNCVDSMGIEPTASVRSLMEALQLGEAGLLRVLQQQQERREERLQEGGEPATKPKSAAPGSLDSIAGAPALPNVLAVGDEDLVGLQEQEEKIVEWVARLKGISLP